MARTWSLVTTISPPATGQAIASMRALNFGDSVVFVARGIFYKWNGVSATAISTTTTFPSAAVGGGGPGIYDFCVFNGQLFAMVGYLNAGEIDYIYRYSGSGTSWVLDTTLQDEDALFPYPHAGVSMPTVNEHRYFWMDCDANYMYIACNQAVGGSLSTNNARMIYRNTSGVYGVATMPGGGYDAGLPQLVGLSKGSQYGAVLTTNYVSSNNYRTVQSGSPNFSNLAGSAIGDKRLIGYADGKSFFSVADGGNYELKYSSDWGVNLVAAGNIENPGTGGRSSFVFKDCGDGVIMLAVDPSATDAIADKIFTWDPATNEFVADGFINNSLGVFCLIYDFFVLNGALYALTNSATSNSVDIWTGGSLSVVKFYQGVDSLAFKSDIPVAGVDPGGLAVNLAGIAVVGSNGPSAQMVVRASSPYTSWADLTGSIPNTAAVRTVRWTPWEVKRG